MKPQHTLLAIAVATVSFNAHAGLAPPMAPLDPVIGFPTYYQDYGDPLNSINPIQPVALELCVPDNVELSSGICLVTPDMLQRPADPVTSPGDNFPDEAFYYNARTKVTLPNIGNLANFADLRMALEATVVPGPNGTFTQSVFTRIRYKFFAPVTGSYSVQTPYTLDTLITAQQGALISNTVDVGIACADFSCALAGSTDPFLRASDSEGGAPAPLLQIGNHTYLGNPVVDTFITGGPQGNKFVITVVPEGSVTPNVIVDTNKFQLMGRVFDGPVPLPIPRPKPKLLPAAAGLVSQLATVASPSVSISAVDPLASEASGDSGKFMINLSAPSAKNIKVKYSIEGNAKKGKDYRKFSSSMVIPAGSVFGAIDVWPVDDKVSEKTEKVTLKLSNKDIKGYSVKGQTVAHVKILDND